jgi:hypothetical protein
MVTMLTPVALAESSEKADRPHPPPSAPGLAFSPTFRHRALLGFAFGFVGGSTKLNGESVAEDVYQDALLNGGLDFGLEERFTRLFSLAARARVFSWHYGSSDTLGYQRSRWDFGLEPRLWIRPKSGTAVGSNFIARRVEGYAGLGSGVTLASETPPPRRAYDERTEGSPGYYLSACVGTTLSGEFAALFIEFGYAFHSTHIDATLEPRAPGVPRTVEERDFVDHAFMFSIGLAAGFGVLE